MSYHPNSISTVLATQSGTVSYAQQDCAVQQPKLEALLDRMHQVRMRTGDAASKALLLADRLLGSEPANIAGTGQPSAKEAVSPPIVFRLEQMVQELLELSDTTHRHLDRLQRL